MTRNHPSLMDQHQKRNTTEWKNFHANENHSPFSYSHFSNFFFLIYLARLMKNEADERTRPHTPSTQFTSVCACGVNLIIHQYVGGLVNGAACGRFRWSTTQMERAGPTIRRDRLTNRPFANTFDFFCPDKIFSPSLLMIKNTRKILPFDLESDASCW